MAAEIWYVLLLQIEGLQRHPRYGAPVKHRAYKNMYDALRRILQNEGWAGLYKGIVPSVIKAGTSWGRYICCIRVYIRLVRVHLDLKADFLGHILSFPLSFWLIILGSFTFFFPVYVRGPMEGKERGIYIIVVLLPIFIHLSFINFVALTDSWG